MRIEVSGARAMAAKLAAMPTTANAPGLSVLIPHTGASSSPNPAPTAAPMNSEGMKAPPDPLAPNVREVTTTFSNAKPISTHHT